MNLHQKEQKPNGYYRSYVEGKCRLIFLLLLIFLVQFLCQNTVRAQDEEVKQHERSIESIANGERNSKRRAEKEQRAEERRAKREKYEQRKQERREAYKKRQEERKERIKERWERLRNSPFFPGEWEFNATNIQNALSVVFPSDKPRDVLEGTLKGFQSVITGVSIGTGSLMLFTAALMANIQQEHSEGSVADVGLKSKLLALAVGVFAGSVTWTLSTVAGIFYGTYQLVFGVLMTPSAILQSVILRQKWDPENRQWISNYYLKDEQELLREYQSQWVADSTFYDLLGVPKVGATTNEIKKAYKRLALIWHPDKNPDNEEAAQKFIELTNAYHTLIDDEKRAAYDQQGYSEASGAGGGPFRINVFFAILFGSQLVEPYVGTLTVPTLFSRILALYHSGSIISTETFTVWQDESDHNRRKRQVEVATNLHNRIEALVAGAETEQAFLESCRQEADEIATTGYGHTFLVAIGSELQFQARHHLAWHEHWWGFPLGLYYDVTKALRKTMQTIHCLSKTAELIWNLVSQSTAVPDADNNNRNEQAGSQHGSETTGKGKQRRISSETIQKMLPEIMEMAWAHNLRDVATTLDGACRRLFEDAGAASLEENIQRAKALRMLGEEFTKRAARDGSGKASSSSDDREGGEGSCMDEDAIDDDLKARLEVAFKLAQMESHAEKMTSKTSEEMIQRTKREAQ